VWTSIGGGPAAIRARRRAIVIRTVQVIGGWTSLDQMMEYLGVKAEIRA
jgi:hypothetical protein